MTPLQIIQSLLSIGFAVAAVIMCAETRRYLIRAQAAATRAMTAAERAEAALGQAKALRAPEVTAVGDKPNPPPAPEVDDGSCRPGPGCCVNNDTFAPATCSFCGSREKCVNHPGAEALAAGAAGHLFSPSRWAGAPDSEPTEGP